MMITYAMIMETGERVTFVTDSMNYIRRLKKEIKEVPRELKATPVVIDVEVISIERERRFRKA